MVINIKINENKWLLELEGIYKGNNIRKRYRNKENIKNFILSLDSPSTVIIGINDMKLLYDDCTLILNDYKKNKDNDLYKYIVSNFSKETNIVNVFKTNIDKLKKVTKRIIINRNTFVALAASLVLTCGIIKFNEDSSKPVTITVEDSFEGYKDNILEENIFENEITNIDSILEHDYKEEIEETFDINEYISLDNRIMEFKSIGNENGIFKVGSKIDQYTLNKIVSFMKENGEVFNTSALKYGVDPYLLLSISLTESSLLHEKTIPGGTRYNGCAIGVTQIEEVHIGEDLTAYNYLDNSYDTVKITEERLIDFTGNVETCAMMMQNSLKKYNNNVYITMQAHNYGTAAMDMIISKYANEVGKTFDEVTLNTTDFGWMKYVDDVHYNPKNYFSKWSYKTYGNNEYISKVLGYYMGKSLVNNNDENYFIYDLVSNTCELQKKHDNLQLVSNKTK